MPTRLTSPTLELANAYRAMLADWGDEPRVPFVLDYPHDDFDALLARLDSEERGLDLQPGWVPHSSYWLVDERDAIVAVSSLRHELTDGLRRIGGHIGYGVPPSVRGRGHATEVLARTLEKARARGIHRALLTCDASNKASAKTIVRNGGVLDGESRDVHSGQMVRRYWVDWA